jgi:hypothetical protein
MERVPTAAPLRHEHHPSQFAAQRAYVYAFCTAPHHLAQLYRYSIVFIVVSYQHEHARDLVNCLNELMN